MNFASLYRASFYLMLFFATLTMSADVTDNRFAFLFPVGVACAGALAFLTVDRNAKLSLSRPSANALGLASIGLVFLEYTLDPSQLLMALAHFLVYLQLIKIFLVKTPQDDWFLFLLGLMQVLVGAVISQSDRLGMILFIWAFLSLWVLALFSLHRDALRHGATTLLNSSVQEPEGVAGVVLRPLPVKNEPGDASEDEAKDPYPGLLDFPFVFSALRVLLLTLALGGVIFLAMPRSGQAGRATRGSEPMAKHLTGFDEEVQLGQLGEILENDSVVMSVELEDQNGAPYLPTEELLWRGVTMANYEKGRWHRQDRANGYLPKYSDSELEQRPFVRQIIKLESNDSPVLFGLRPVLKATANQRQEPELNAIDGTFSRPDSRGGTFDYELYSDLPAKPLQYGEEPPSPERLAAYRRMPEDLKTRFSAIAKPLLENIPESDIEARARALEKYFANSGEFTYTLRMSTVDPSLDPVEDFLINRKEGHCEYYASALTLLLRSVNIPARMVNGFKGGDWNALTKVMNVRQKFAHSWVEVYLGDRNVNSSTLPIWLTLDPTPGLERRESIAKVGGINSNFRQITDLIRYIWVFFVVGYNADRQSRLVYEPIQELVASAKSGFAMMGDTIRPALANLLHFKNFGQFISIRGFIVSFVALLLLAGIIHLLRQLVLRLLRWYRGPNVDSDTFGAGVVFYRRLMTMLADLGLERPPAETQSEFARRASLLLSRQGSNTEVVSEVPRLVVDAFYRVRFGNLTLSQEALDELEARLDALEASLRASRSS